ncbi:MAG: hypothetical protein JWL90_1742, partial [Chthoniobacteraceae bacterium]|nr:hypothetical protein [Chthoniobacteraceae bacterium]
MSRFPLFQSTTDKRLRLVNGSSAALIAIGLTVILGWLFDQRQVIRLLPGSITMKSNTALCFMLCGMALWMTRDMSVIGKTRCLKQQTSILLSIIVITLSFATASEYFFGTDLHIDEWLVKDVVQNRELYFPGRMSPVTAFNFVCLGSALLSLALRRSPYLTQGLAAGAAFSTILVIVGTSYGLAALSVGGRTIGVAFHTSLGMILLCIGIFCASGEQGIMKLLLDGGSAGFVARRLLPAAILVPAVIGALRTWGETHGLFGTELGISILSVSNVVTFGSLVWASAHFLQKSQTETQDAQAALHKSLERYTFLADCMPQMVWTARPDGRIDYYNQAWFDYTGMSIEQAVDWGWVPVLHPDDHQACIQRWTHSISTGENYEIEYRFKRACDGIYRWHLGRARPMRDAKGTITHWVGTCTDIDEQKLAEEALACRVQDRTIALSMAITELNLARQTSELIFAHSLDIICTLDESGRFSEVSQACQGVWGYRPEELIGKPSLEIVHPDDRQKTLLERSEIITGNAATNFENRYLHKDGSVIPMVWSANWSAEARLMFCVARDVSAHKRTEAELEKMHRELLETSRQAGMAEVATSVLHNVGNVLNSVNVS